VAACALAACHTPSREQLTGQASDEWVRQYTLAADGELQLTNGNGAMTVEAVDGDAVDVRVERIVKAATNEAAKEVVPRITIHEEISPNKIALRTEGLSGIVIGIETRVNYHVRAPRKTRLRVRSVGGPLTVKGFEGRTILSSVNGGVTAEALKGGVEARSTNGDAKIGLAAFGDDLVDIRVTNGGLHLDVPAKIDANLTASVVNGKIDVTKLKFEPLGEQNARRIRGRVNDGGTPIDIAVTNGSVVVTAQ
jgi:hypothetical protein